MIPYMVMIEDYLKLMVNPDTLEQMTWHFQFMDMLREWIYDHPGGGAGGPLHIILDDANLDDGSLDFCQEKLNEWKPDADEDMKAICLAMLQALRLLTHAQRFLWSTVYDGKKNAPQEAIDKKDWIYTESDDEGWLETYLVAPPK